MTRRDVQKPSSQEVSKNLFTTLKYKKRCPLLLVSSAENWQAHVFTSCQPVSQSACPSVSLSVYQSASLSLSVSLLVCLFACQFGYIN